MLTSYLQSCLRKAAGWQLLSFLRRYTCTSTAILRRDKESRLHLFPHSFYCKFSYLSGALRRFTLVVVLVDHLHGLNKPPHDIDLKPGGDDNQINPDIDGVVPIAVLGTDKFDPTSDNINYRFGAPDVVADDGGSHPLHDATSST